MRKSTKPLQIAKGLTVLLPALVVGVGAAPLPSTLPTPISAPALRARFSSELQSLVLDSQDGRLDQHSLLEAALILDRSLTAKERGVWLAEVHRWLEATIASAPANDQPEKLAQYLLTDLHAQFLNNGYRAETSAPSDALETRSFNCVSATILFVHVAEKAGLRVRPIATHSHVLAEVLVGDDWRRLETTRPGQAPFNETNTSQVADKPSEPWKVLTRVELAALPTFNLGADAFAEGRYGIAVRSNELALEFAPTLADAEVNLLLAKAKLEQIGNSHLRKQQDDAAHNSSIAGLIRPR